jgi:hypothetical protein
MHQVWRSTAASKLECGRLCCNLLDALASSNLANWCHSWGKSPWLQPRPLAAAYLSVSLPLALLLPLHHVPLSCMQLLSCQACHLLPSISSPALCPHCVPLLVLSSDGLKDSWPNCQSKVFVWRNAFTSFQWPVWLVSLDFCSDYNPPGAS